GTEGISAFTDTVFSVYYALLTRNRPLNMILGFNTNLPTGKATLTNTEVKTEFGLGDNNDWVHVDNFGDGFIVNPSIGIAKELAEVGIGLGAGYLVNGTYDPTTDIANDDLNPGDLFYTTLDLEFVPLEWLALSGAFQYTYSGADTVRNKDTFKQGDIFTLGLDLTFKASPYTSLAIAVRENLRQDNERFADFSLDLPARRIDNGNETFVSAFFSHTITDPLTLTSLVDFKFYDDNHLASDDQFFKGEKRRYTAGVGVSYRLRQTLSVGSQVKFLFYQEDQRLIEQREEEVIREDITLRGFSLEFTITQRF
ncbi:MAG: hypothetical protein L0Y56_16170, partial [Nitrospira sp.]|nr:hypothetical protein [Nitrospira sp.]